MRMRQSQTVASNWETNFMRRLNHEILQGIRAHQTSHSQTSSSQSLKLSNRTMMTLWKLWIKLEGDVDQFSKEFRCWGRFSKWCPKARHWQRHLAIKYLKTQESHWNEKDFTKNWMIINLILKLWNRKILILPFFIFFWIQRFSNCKEWNIYCWILWISCLFMKTACWKLIESWLQFSKPHNLFQQK